MKAYFHLPYRRTQGVVIALASKVAYMLDYRSLLCLIKLGFYQTYPIPNAKEKEGNKMLSVSIVDIIWCYFGTRSKCEPGRTIPSISYTSAIKCTLPSDSLLTL